MFGYVTSRVAGPGCACALLGGMLLAGCQSDQGLGKYDGNAGALGPIIEVTPRELDFGSLATGEHATQSFTVANVGAAESILEVSDIRLTGPASGYTIVSGNTNFSLTPEDPPEQIVVDFTPWGANAQLSEAIVDSNDEESPHASVDLRGEGLVPELLIDPDPLDMGTTYVGCDKDNVITLTNVGTDVLTISAIDHAGPSDVFAFTQPNALPLSLNPGDFTTVSLDFIPLAEQHYDTTLTVTSNEPYNGGVRSSAQGGDGLFVDSHVDSFEVPTSPTVDILFAVDQSGSMDDDQAALASNFSAFISQLSYYTDDWQIMVANDDDGCNNSGILTTDTPNYQTQFTRAVSQGGGAWTEALLTVTSTAIQKTGGGECNQGFLRTDALLHVIIVSDEPEQSVRSWDHYVNILQSEKGDPSLVKISAVAGDYPGGCSTGRNSAEPGTGYYEAVSYTGGEFLSICSDWSENVDALADASIRVTSFTLTHTPVPSSIVVEVNDVVRASGWHYDATANAVVFDTDAPEEGSIVDVAYGELATCD